MAGEPLLERFDPGTLDRTIISIPLLKQIESEKALKEKVRKNSPEQAASFNAVIVLPRKSAATKKEVRDAVQKILDEAVAGEASEVVRSKTKLGPKVTAVNG